MSHDLKKSKLKSKNINQSIKAMKNYEYYILNQKEQPYNSRR